MEANKAKEEAKQESQSTTIITQEDIAQKQAKSVEDILFNETGVTRTVDAMGRVGVSIRGAEPRHTLILIDGQPVMGDVSKYNGQGDELQRLGTENVERIEIIKGAASAKYGSDAIGGVINVVTRRPSDQPGLQVNAEGRRAKGNGDIFPYQNVFLRADSGKIGKFKAAVYGSKRDIMPVYGVEDRYTGLGQQFHNSLRYYGDIKNVGLIGSYEFNKNNKIDFNVDRTKENMERLLKRSTSSYAPQQHFKRDLTRDKESIVYTGNNGGSTDWKISYDYAKLTEADSTLSSNYGYSEYEGKNTLDDVDDLLHKQWNFNASANTQLNEHHLLSYGFGYTKETGIGSRLKSAPNTWVEEIDPWKYDKNLHTEQPVYGSTGTGIPSSNVHLYPITANAAGVPQYDENYDLYGVKDSKGNSMAPSYTYEDYYKYKAGNHFDKNAPADVVKRYNDFKNELITENKITNAYLQNMAVENYYNLKFPEIARPAWQGQKFYTVHNMNDNKVMKGRADINRYHVFVQDTWQINQNTVLSPILRLDHSSLFGSNVSFNIGMTHHIQGSPNHRFKANIGTGYTEPGMGELYYNWEMYSGALTGDNEGRLGYYWIGNPDLKPEKSVNFDLGLESENGKTATRFNVFHNRIKDYISTYFTGYLMDYYPTMPPSIRFWAQLPDMIYSFRNIGKAEITGFEAEINHQFNVHWSSKLGYTYLHALNKSDPDMPRQLLDKPQHKIDVGVTYENKKGGWRASLWGNYYLNMLDSNSIANNGNTLHYDGASDSVVYNFAEGGKQTYQKKTFGLWNFLIQKELSKDSSMYFGVDNIFNHRDDDRAFMERVYKIGLNMKFGPDGSAEVKKGTGTVADTPAAKKDISGISKIDQKRGDADWFITAPFDTTTETEGVDFIGDYQTRWNSFSGKNKPSKARVTTTATVGTAYKNYLEKAEHGFEQRLRAGVNARIGDNTNVTLLGSASGMSGVDTMHDVSDSKGLNHQRVDTVDVTQHVNAWDFSIGRLTEPMGMTGYWFGKEYDGGRAVWTSGKNQVRLGYGDFRQSTGITDSAYTHATIDTFWRAPTKSEWLGCTDFAAKVVNVPGYEGLTQKLQKAESWEACRSLIKQYLQVIREKDPAGYDMLMKESEHDINYTVGYGSIPVLYKVTITDPHDSARVLGEYVQIKSKTDGFGIKGHGLGDLLDTDLVTSSVQKEFEDAEAKDSVSKNRLVTGPDGQRIRADVHTEFLQFGAYTGSKDAQTIYSQKNVIPIDEITAGELTKMCENAADAVQQFLGSRKGETEAGSMNEVAYQLLRNISGYSNWNPEDGSSLPLNFFTDGSVGLVPVVGTILVQDQIPPIDKAVFAQAKHQFGDDFGVQAWYLRSVGDDTHSIAYAHGDQNDVASFDQLANVIGIGATWRLGDNIRFSYDWGQNRTDFGRFMNGNTIYNHETGTSDFDIAGRSNGGTPRFWVARVDIGKADTDKPGSWNAFADYKYFQHGSFFGGNGTEGVPDRYLDGIKSFTIGGGYVPAKDFLLEAFYTFDAKGIGKRDTLYGSENFSLGDYTRIQATFKF